MSASTPGGYRSRLFNLINHHSRRFIDRGERAIRHLKVAAVWGTQILLYPIYMVVQASLTAGRQLSAEAKAGWIRLKALTQSQPPEPPPAVDTPIQRVLKQVETLQFTSCTILNRAVKTAATQTKPAFAGSPILVPLVREGGLGLSSCEFDSPRLIGIEPNQITDTPNLNISSSSRVEIQGVATLLPTRTLVLVSITNEILDILTPEQQQKLAARISWELATLYRQWRLTDNLKTSRVQRQLSHLAKPSLFLPLRLFWQLMAWVQTSPVAIAINLFGESSLVPVRDSAFSEPASDAEITQNLASSWWERLTPGVTLAAIDDTIAQWELHPLQTSNHVAIALRHRSHSLLQTFQTSFITPRQSTDPTQTSASHSFWLMGLIYAAIDYFFGQRSSNPFHHQDTTSVNPTEDINQRFANSTSFVTLPGAEFTYTTEPDPWLNWDDLFGCPNPTFTPNIALQISGLSTLENNLKPETVVKTPDWIETEAISTGYVKHPLEQILEWLDVGMLLLEEVTIKAWQWMRQFFTKDNA
ncbi:MAG: hypothetical protein RH949_26810 [Coleofasciculus sp. A1-SPW-01]|uniref:hypothetical protein n=1 Tax=Coleofasciculus sp. A1-SPW-01 TaxID=3070819 RepID=UPI0032F77702